MFQVSTPSFSRLPFYPLNRRPPTATWSCTERSSSRWCLVNTLGSWWQPPGGEQTFGPFWKECPNKKIAGHKLTHAVSWRCLLIFVHISLDSNSGRDRWIWPVRAEDVFHVCVFVWETQWAGESSESSDLWSYEPFIHSGSWKCFSIRDGSSRLPRAPAGFFVGKKGVFLAFLLYLNPSNQTSNTSNIKKNCWSLIASDCWERSMLQFSNKPPKITAVYLQVVAPQSATSNSHHFSGTLTIPTNRMNQPYPNPNPKPP